MRRNRTGSTCAEEGSNNHAVDPLPIVNNTARHNENQKVTPAVGGGTKSKKRNI